MPEDFYRKHSFGGATKKEKKLVLEGQGLKTPVMGKDATIEKRTGRSNGFQGSGDMVQREAKAMNRAKWIRSSQGMNMCGGET